MSISVRTLNNRIIPHTEFTFSGGEEHVKWDPYYITSSDHLIVDALLTSSELVMKLLLTVNAIRQINPSVRLTLNMPYIPYARQDRVCSPGEALSIRVFCDLINSLKFDRVVVLMPHSDVATALLNNVDSDEYQSQWDEGVAEEINKESNLVVISPDAGAMKRTLKFVQFFNSGWTNGNNPVQIVSADKVRNVVTGEITSTVLHVLHTDNEIEGKTCVIYDDICDGGMTFIKLAEELRFHGAAKVILAVPHGIFSKGFGVLSKGIDKIITTDTFLTNDMHLDAVTRKINLTKIEIK